jgi:hypothetical protein
MFAKVLPRTKAERLRLLPGSLENGAVRLAMPAASVGGDAFLFEPAPGRSLRELLVFGRSLPSPDRVASLPGTVAALGTGPPHPGGPSSTETVAASAAVLERLAPEAAGGIERVVEAVSDASVRPSVAPLVHGDMYEAQVFVDDDYSLGLIDLDDMGPGDPAVDAANFCAHLLVLALAVPAAADRLVAYRRLVRDAFLRRLDVPPADLAWREAMAALLLASGPFRVLDPRWPVEVVRRIRLAVRLLDQP